MARGLLGSCLSHPQAIPLNLDRIQGAGFRAPIYIYTSFKFNSGAISKSDAFWRAPLQVPPAKPAVGEATPAITGLLVNEKKTNLP